MSALDITLSPEEKAELNRRVRSATIPQREDRRARIILLAAQGETREEIARLTGFSCPTITTWCQRFQLHRLDGLIDKPGRGRKSPLSADTVRRVLEQVTKPRIGQPRWSCRSMARAVGVSSTTVHKLWAANDLKPHLTAPSNCQTIRSSNTNSGMLSGFTWPRRTRHWCCVAMKKIRFRPWSERSPDCLWASATSRQNPMIYTRHGTVTLFAALDYLQGKLISSIERQHRHQEWLAFLKKINRQTH